LANAINQYFSDNWYAEFGQLGRRNDSVFGGQFHQELDRDWILPTLSSWVAGEYILMPLVQVSLGFSCEGGAWGPNGALQDLREDCQMYSGRLGKTWIDWMGFDLGPINHWVVITGVSAGQHHDDRVSMWNWVRIVNPFDNQTEYYMWWEVLDAWREGDAGYTALRISRNRR
jgi:hypothetical protein